jgi:hypothetical protein
MTERGSICFNREPARDWRASKATTKALAEKGIEVSAVRTLLRMNQPEGLDRSGSAWSDVISDLLRESVR